VTTRDLDRQDPGAANRQGSLLAVQGAVAGARLAYQRTIDSGDLDAAPGAASNLGLLLAGQGDVTGAKAAYQQAINSGHHDAAARAAVNLRSLPWW
jgi:predicted negative regulator of RcsB-dependent stress response